MIALILLSLVIIGAATIIFFKNQNDVYHLERLKRKEQSLMISLNYFVIENNISIYNPRLEGKINELADIHNLDLNIYTYEGDFLGSTQKDEQRIQPEQKVVQEMIDSLKKSVEPIIIQKEINNDSYLSTYFILFNSGNLPIGIINVPYFKDYESNQRVLSKFLSTLAQIYIILFIGASILAYFLSSYMTNSLRAIREKLSHFQIDKKNEKLEWGSHDEIGALVNDYNRMVDELEKSAELLARSEREHAWKEMAKQVAHEIKNPLTPMRLSLQHFQRMIKDNPDDLAERFQRFSVNMLEQIETLSKIATEFSNFAKMPKANREEIVLHQLIEPAIGLFEQNPEIEIVYYANGAENAQVYADKAQILRVLNNLVNNSIQSIPEGAHGKVIISLKQEAKTLLLSVQDNGNGIRSELREKIFQPNFTTKSSGTGLGLAMVKNIIASHEGEIWFETEEGKGTLFFIRLNLS